MDTYVVCRHKHGKLTYDAQFKVDVFIPTRVVCIDCLHLHLTTHRTPLPKEIVDLVMEIAQRISRA